MLKNEGKEIIDIDILPKKLVSHSIIITIN